MKKLMIMIALFGGLGFASCTYQAEEKQEVNKDGKEYTSAYICPMHCEGSGSEAEGQCPVCKMDYVKNPSHKGGMHEGMHEDMHNESSMHLHDYSCPDHPEISGHEGDSCSTCGTLLTETKHEE